MTGQDLKRDIKSSASATPPFITYVNNETITWENLTAQE